MYDVDYLIEKRLRELNPELHKRFSDTALSLLRLLSKYEEIFPDYTDHSEMHTLAVIDFCNTLIGPERIKQMNADELYVLLMGCYFHDVGMGTSEKDLEEFNSQIDMREYLAPLYDISAISDPHQIFEFKKHEAVRRVDITDDAFTLIVKTEEEKDYDGILELAGKMRMTLDYCVKVAEERTPWTITQREVLLSSE